MGSGRRHDSGVLLVEPPERAALEVDLATGPASSLAGMRRLLGALVEAGATFGGLPERHPAEWGRLTRPSRANGRALAGLARSPSERRLRGESEQVFRVLAVAAAAVCRGAHGLGVPVVLRGVGRTDLTSLRGVVRAGEYAAATGVGRLSVPADDAVRVLPVLAGAADTRAERARCLRALGLDVDEGDLRVVPAPGVGLRPPQAEDQAHDAALLAAALDTAGTCVDRLRSVLAYCRSSFYSGNWEGMALVASACLPHAARLTAGEVAGLAAGDDSAGDDSAGDDQTAGSESALIRHPGDLHAYLLKILGIQASFRGRYEHSLEYFRAMRDVEGPISVETRAQSHLYSALTLAELLGRLPSAVSEVEAGFAVVRERPGDPASVRRERGWLHNVRGLTLSSAGDPVAALEHEQRALGCVEGLTDPGSVHLRADLVSNISMLQEGAGRLRLALATWERLRQDGAGADPAFVKYHAYRSGGLLVRAGDVDEGLIRVGESLRRCVEAADDFHEFEIAAELGAMESGRDRRDAATEHFDRAGLAAARLGDPYRMALAAVGRAVATGAGLDGHTAALAHHCRTRIGPARALLVGCRDGADPGSLLPSLRTTLDRPFDLINI